MSLWRLLPGLLDPHPWRAIVRPLLGRRRTQGMLAPLTSLVDPTGAGAAKLHHAVVLATPCQAACGGLWQRVSWLLATSRVGPCMGLLPWGRAQGRHQAHFACHWPPRPQGGAPGALGGCVCHPRLCRVSALPPCGPAQPLGPRHHPPCNTPAPAHALGITPTPTR